MIKFCSDKPEKLEIGWQFTVCRYLDNCMFYHKCEDVKWYAPAYAFRIKSIK